MACKCRRWQAVATAAPGPGGVTRRLRVTGECECPPEDGPPTVRATDLITEELVVLDVVAGPVDDPGRQGVDRPV